MCLLSLNRLDISVKEAMIRSTPTETATDTMTKINKTKIEIDRISSTHSRIVKRSTQSGKVLQVILDMKADEMEREHPDWFQARIEGAWDASKRLFGEAGR